MRLLTFTLNEIQLREVKAALAKLEAGHHARVAWFDDHSLDENVLSIHALDFVTVLSHCLRTQQNEIELFRLRRTAIRMLSIRYSKTKNETKKLNIKICKDQLEKVGFGSEYETDLKSAPKLPIHIQTI